MKEKNISQPRVSPGQKIALVILGLILSLVLLEGGLRLGGFVILSIQEYRNLQSIQQKGAYRILCLGESTTQGQYPHLLERVLNERNIGVHFSVIDKGLAGTNTSDILSRVESFLDEYHPDMVVAMMGINDEGEHMPLEAPTTSKGTLFIQSLRIYKLERLLWLHLLTKAHGMKICKTAKHGQSPEEIQKSLPKTESQETSNEPISGEATFKKAIALDPHNDHAYVRLGWLYKAHHKLSQAEASFKKAIEIEPKSDHAYTGLWRLYLDQGDRSKAEASVKKAIEINPENEKAFIQLGWIYLWKGEFSEAEGLLKKAIEIYPKNDRAYVGLAGVYRDQAKFSEAEGLLKKAVEINPKNDRAYAELGWIYQRKGEYSKAEGLLKKAGKINPKFDRYYVNLGKVYRDQAKFSEAEGLLKKGDEINPKNDRILGALSSLYEEMGKPELAEEYSKKTEKLREFYNPMTMNSYRKLKDSLDQHRIRLVCVQYPVRSVEPLKKLFEKEKGVIFVDNGRIFKEAVKKGSYKEYFRDMFGGDFGHCTEKGNALLAQNIAEVILREVFNR